MSSDLSHPYFPAFSTREHELRAYAKLDDGTKDAMLPVVMLTRAREAVSFSPALEAALEAANGRPLIVDFDAVPKTEKSDEEIAVERRTRQAKARADGREPRPATAAQEARWAAQRDATREFNGTIRRMSAPTDGYAFWRAFTMVAPNIIPQARLDDPAAALTQVEAIVSAGRKVAFRLELRNPASVASFLYAARGLGSGEEAIVLLDAGYVRDDLPAGYRRVEEALDVVRRGLGSAHFDAITKVCMSGSFPTSLRDVPTSLRILERDLHQALVRKGWDVRYGDHASVHQRVANMVANGWFPHVDDGLAVRVLDLDHFGTMPGDAALQVAGALELGQACPDATIWVGRVLLCVVPACFLDLALVAPAALGLCLLPDLHQSVVFIGLVVGQVFGGGLALQLVEAGPGESELRHGWTPSGAGAGGTNCRRRRVEHDAAHGAGFQEFQDGVPGGARPHDRQRTTVPIRYR